MRHLFHGVQLLLITRERLWVDRRPVVSVTINHTRQTLVGLRATFRGQDQQPLSTWRGYLGYCLWRVFPCARPDDHRPGKQVKCLIVGVVAYEVIKIRCDLIGWLRVALEIEALINDS